MASRAVFRFGCANDIYVYTLLQETDCRRMPEDMRRHTTGHLLGNVSREKRGVPLDDLVDAETRQRLVLARHRQRGDPNFAESPKRVCSISAV